MTCQPLRIFLLTTLLLISTLAHAGDAYYDYLADFYQHESNQARHPNQIIRFADAEQGALLQSVLEPARVKAVLNTFYTALKRGEQLPEVPKLLQPLMVRYDGAFKKEPQTYEKEYLDSLEAFIEIMTMATQMTNVPLQSSTTSKTSGMDPAQQKALEESLQSMAKVARNASSAVFKALSVEIRNRATKGMFSDIGAKRAVAIAERLVQL